MSQLLFQNLEGAQRTIPYNGVQRLIDIEPQIRQAYGLAADQKLTFVHKGEALSKNTPIKDMEDLDAVGAGASFIYLIAGARPVPELDPAPGM